MSNFENTSSSFASNLVEGKHCATCQCCKTESFFQWNNTPKAMSNRMSRVGTLVQTRVLPPNDPSASQVGDQVLENRTVWFRSVSPRPSKITIRVSSPDRPNLRPSQVSMSPANRPLRLSLAKGIEESRVTMVESQSSFKTPLKKLVSRTTMDNEQSTMYSADTTEIKTPLSFYGYN